MSEQPKVDKRIGNVRAGRKPLSEDERRIPIQIYIPKWRVDRLGGTQAARDFLHTAFGDAEQKQFPEKLISRVVKKNEK